MFYINFRKSLLAALILMSVSTAQPSIYSIFDKVGCATDWFLTKGDLSEHNQKLFEEMAAKLGIQDRNIKAKNSGLFLRLMAGYQNALAMQHLNRTYFNDTVLNEMSDDAKRFLMAHELVHHRQNHVFKRGLAIMLLKCATIASTIALAGQNNFNARYLSNGINLRIARLSLWKLIEAQIMQGQETEADTKAITIACADPEFGVEALDSLYHPNATDWPLYAKVLLLFQKATIWLYDWPILKQHAPHLVSYKERVAYVRSLKKNKNQINS
ncbi:hypothetical protein A3F06_03905 [candidate division TM6 bacterium RIFCSPHIGHO2_12_FULL_36_22]|nr:MAG: hypothetical protein A3F06_03905 [candidate division TM6 bacterium RIFCSPHIGHO2_12_FULL_36_22]